MSGAMRTPPKATPTASSSSEIAMANTIAFTIFARKYAGSGMGEARFTCSHPWPRSIAMPTPKLNMATPITP